MYAACAAAAACGAGPRGARRVRPSLASVLDLVRIRLWWATSMQVVLLLCSTLWTAAAATNHSSGAFLDNFGRHGLREQVHEPNDHDSTDLCPAVGSLRSSTDFAQLLALVREPSFSSGQIKALRDHVADHPGLLTAGDIIQILGSFSFSADQVSALAILGDYAVGMNCTEVAPVLRSFSFSSDRLVVLTALARLGIITNPHNPTGVSEILTTFSFSSDQQSARDILANAKQRSCIYGTISATRVHFVVDVSGSMGGGPPTYPTPLGRFVLNGATTTRLAYVSSQLEQVIAGQLSSEQSFNLFKFSDSVSTWKPDLQPLNQENIELARNYINSWVANGGTDTYDALHTAFTTSADEVAAVYLLSDGMPNGHTADQIVAAARQWSANSKRNVPVHTCAFVMGGNEGASEKAAAVKFMRDLADATWGAFVLLDHNASR